MCITYKDDCKGKWQSHEATIELESGDWDDQLTLSGTAYGKDREEARQNLMASLKAMKAKLDDLIGEEIK